MKSFKGSSNKLGPLGFLGRQMYEPPFEWHNSFAAIHIRIGAVLYPTWQAPFAPFRVTTDKLKKVLILD
jgi:hypothetical protein